MVENVLVAKGLREEYLSSDGPLDVIRKDWRSGVRRLKRGELVDGILEILCFVGRWYSSLGIAGWSFYD